MSYLPTRVGISNDSYIRRIDFIKLMLEHKEPALVFNTILENTTVDVIQKAIKDTSEYGFVVNAVSETYMVENGLVTEQKLFERYGSRSNTGYGDSGKIANSSGKDSLKKLIGKSGKSQKVSTTDWRRVGEIIAGMEGYNKRDYVGMMNFLSTSCWMQKYILNKLGNEYRKIAKRQHNPQKPAPKKQETKKVEQPTEVNKIQPAEVVNDSLVFGFTQYIDINERLSAYKTMSGMSMEDFIQTMSSVINRLSDLQLNDVQDQIEQHDDYFDINGDYDDAIEQQGNKPDNLTSYNDIVDYDNDNIIKQIQPVVPDYFRNTSINERTGNSYDSSDKTRIRTDRENGKGGLKELVGKRQGDDLDVGDLSRIASSIKTMDKEDRGYYINLVSFMGSACPIFNAIVNGFLSKLQKDIYTQFRDGSYHGNVMVRKGGRKRKIPV